MLLASPATPACLIEGSGVVACTIKAVLVANMRLAEKCEFELSAYADVMGAISHDLALR